MSSSSLATIQTQLNLYSYPLVMIFGSIGNIFIILIFHQQRQNACSLYLVTSAIANLLYLILNGLSKLFYSYSEDGTIRAIILCKIYTYIPNFLGQVAKTMLILACIDRYMITHDRANRRALSTHKRAKYFIFFGVIFWAVAASHVPILTTSVNGQCTKVGTYGTFFTFYTIVVVGLIPSLTLSVFGYLTYRNMRQIQRRIQPIGQDSGNVNHAIRRRDRSLLIMVISEVFVYILSAAVFPFVLLEMMISQYTTKKSFQQVQTELFILNIAFLLLFIYSGIPFYVYLISSKPFRREFKELIIKNYQKLTGQVILQHESKQDTALTQQDTRV